jgi:hypothetical protein
LWFRDRERERERREREREREREEREITSASTVAENVHVFLNYSENLVTQC